MDEGIFTVAFFDEGGDTGGGATAHDGVGGSAGGPPDGGGKSGGAPVAMVGGGARDRAAEIAESWERAPEALRRWANPSGREAAADGGVVADFPQPTAPSPGGPHPPAPSPGASGEGESEGEADWEESSPDVEALRARVSELEAYNPVVDFLRERGLSDGEAAAAKIAEIRQNEAVQAIAGRAAADLSGLHAQLTAAVESGEWDLASAQAFYNERFQDRFALHQANARAEEFDQRTRALAQQRAELEVAQETMEALEQFPSLKREGMTPVLYTLAASLPGGIPEAAKTLNALIEGAVRSARVAAEVQRHERQRSGGVPLMTPGGSPIVPQATPERVHGTAWRDLFGAVGLGR